MTDHQKLFQKHIWQRGKDYNDYGFVSNLTLEDDYVFATVEGSQIYDVVIHFHKNEIDDMECDCLYAMDGNNCKHMAAVLMKMEEEGVFKTIQQKKSQQYDKWETLVDDYNREKKGYRNQIGDINLDRELSTLLEKKTGTLIQSEKWEKLFPVLHEMLVTTNKLNETINLSTTQQAFKKILQTLKCSTCVLQCTHWIKQQFSFVNRTDFLCMLLEQGISKDQAGIGELDQIMKYYHRQKSFACSTFCLKVKINRMEALQYTPQTILNSILMYKNYAVVMDYEIKIDMQNENYEAAKKKLNAYLRIPSLSNQKRQKVMKDLLKVLLMLKEYDPYVEQVITLCKKTDASPIDYMKELLSCEKKEEEQRKIITKIYHILKMHYPSYSVVDVLMNLELYDKAIYEIYDSADFNLMNHYRDALRAYDVQTYSFVFYQCMINALQDATTLDDYSHIRHALYRFLEEKEDTIVLYDIIIYAQEHVKRKKNLLELLQNLCYEEEAYGW